MESFGRKFRTSLILDFIYRSKTMKSFSFFIIAVFSITAHALYSEETKTNQKKPAEQKKEIAKISESFGHLIGKNLESMGVELDIQAIVKGLKDSAAGKNSPMTENECIQALTSAQESAFHQMAEKNLSKAEDFLKKNANQKDIV